MKKNILIAFLFFASACWISFSEMNENESPHSSLKSAGGPPYNTNAPGEKTCSGQEGTNTCHSGGIADNTGPATGTITSSGGTNYIPGQTYTITASITHATRTRFGFQLTARRVSNNSNAGNLTELDTSKNWTQFPGYGNCQTCEFIMHKKAATYFASTTGSWNFTWTAPSTNVGTIRLYACFLAANNNNTNDSGDETYYTNLTLNPSANSVEENDFSSSINVFPNPSSGKFEVKSLKFEVTAAETYNVYGEKVYLTSNLKPETSYEINLPSGLESGIYFLKFSSEGKSALKKIVLSK